MKEKEPILIYDINVFPEEHGMTWGMWGEIFDKKKIAFYDGSKCMSDTSIPRVINLTDSTNQLKVLDITEVKNQEILKQFKNEDQ